MITTCFLVRRKNSFGLHSRPLGSATANVRCRGVIEAPIGPSVLDESRRQTKGGSRWWDYTHLGYSVKIEATVGPSQCMAVEREARTRSDYSGSTGYVVTEHLSFT